MKPAGNPTLEECDTRIRKLETDLVAIRDQITSHQEQAAQGLIKSDAYWLNLARRARRRKEVELAELRAHRRSLRPGKELLRIAFFRVAEERLEAGLFRSLVDEARARVARENPR